MYGMGNIDTINPKIITLEEAVIIASNEKAEGKNVVSTNGCFDILHVGHVRNLQFARSLGDLLIVGINSDTSVQANKGLLRPIVPAGERAEVIAALTCVDYVFIFDALTPIEWLEKIQPAFHVKGSDRTLEQVVEKDVVEKYGGEVVLFPHTKMHSSTDILKTVHALERFKELHALHRKSSEGH